MLQYLIILLDNSSTSFCHYQDIAKENRLISIDDLKKGILFAMKENLTIQFVYPAFPLPKEYYSVIETIDHVKIKPYSSDVRDADIIVINRVSDVLFESLDKTKTYVLRVDKNDFFSNIERIADIINRVARLNIVITDIDSFKDYDFDSYKVSLEFLSQKMENKYVNHVFPQVNLLTDRILLKEMNNCNAGNTSITLAPDGRFYPCPAFYYEVEESKYMGLGGPEKAPFSIGNLLDGLSIKNPQLYEIGHSPICRICDAFQCKRCIWLNWKLTREVNTPSHEQCVLAHLERNASKRLLEKIRQQIDFMPEQDICEIDYLDPLDAKDDWRY